uniref:Transcription termination and cleavage factor C-terminal domain-containing protein n=1 Tax=Picea sitchensis TaxID=3332 RepID=D5A8L7_PICSI|nr:unknown [Picea sitchensis]
MGSGSTVGTTLHVGSDAIRSSTGPSNLASNAGFVNLGIEGALQVGRGSNLIQGLGGIPDVSWSQVQQSAGVVCGDLATVASTSVGIPNIEDGSKVYTAAGGGNGGLASGSSESGVGASPVHSQGPSQMPVEGMSQPQQPPSHGAQLTPELESALLQQVMSLTPEQINSLPPDQQQQVLQLQQMLR